MKNTKQPFNKRRVSEKNGFECSNNNNQSQSNKKLS